MKQTIDKQQMIKLLVANETEHSDPEVTADMRDIRNGLVDAAETFTTGRYGLGAAMYRYHEVIEHGKWGEVLRILAWATGAFERTLREILVDYTRVKDKPEPIIKDLQRRGIDPAAKKNAKVVDFASAGYKAGANPAEAVQAALDKHRRQKTAKRKLVIVADPTPELTQKEKLIWLVRLGIRKGLERVPDNQKLEYLRIAAGEEITALLGDRAKEFVVTPKEPTLDLMGRKRVS